MARSAKIIFIGLISISVGCAGPLNMPAPSPVPDLINAAHRGDAPKVEALLTEGADVNTRDQRGSTALIAASASPQIEREVVQALLAKGADVNAKVNDGTTALMMASSRGHREIVQALLAKGAEVNARANNGMSVLMFAVSSPSSPPREVIQALLAGGADVNTKANDGETALLVASAQGYLDVVQALLAKGADVRLYPRMVSATCVSHSGRPLLASSATSAASSVPRKTRFPNTATPRLKGFDP